MNSAVHMRIWVSLGREADEVPPQLKWRYRTRTGRCEATEGPQEYKRGDSPVQGKAEVEERDGSCCCPRFVARPPHSLPVWTSVWDSCPVSNIGSHAGRMQAQCPRFFSLLEECVGAHLQMWVRMGRNGGGGEGNESDGEGTTED